MYNNLVKEAIGDFINLKISLFCFWLSLKGLDVSHELWQIALNTLNMNLCTSITEELQKQQALTEEQVAMVTFLKELNDLYPSRNFEEQRELYVRSKER